jgi:hypothetical protein
MRRLALVACFISSSCLANELQFQFNSAASMVADTLHTLPVFIS